MHHKLDIHPVPADVLYVNELSLAGKVPYETKDMTEKAITGKIKSKGGILPDDNVRIYVPMDLNANIRLGMNGSDFKATRKILMENLSGHAAFRTDEEAQKFLAREKAKRDALKAAKQAAQEGGPSAGETVASADAEPTQPDCGADTAQMMEAGA